MAANLEPCIPCIKQLIDGRAAQAVAEAHQFFLGVRDLVESGRLNAAMADETLKELIAAEEDLIARVQTATMKAAQATRPPSWWTPPEPEA